MREVNVLLNEQKTIKIQVDEDSLEHDPKDAIL